MKTHERALFFHLARLSFFTFFVLIVLMRVNTCLFFAKWVGKKEKKKLGFDEKRVSGAKLTKFFFDEKKNAQSGVEEKKTKSKKVNSLLVSTKISFFSSLSSRFFARAGTSSQIFCRITQTHPKTFSHHFWYMHTRALTKYHPHKPALTCIFSSF